MTPVQSQMTLQVNGEQIKVKVFSAHGYHSE